MNVRDFLKQDRQWPRQHRISHAKMKFKEAETVQEMQFWLDVIKANEDD